MIPRMTKSLAAVLTAALILPAAATAQTMDFACPDPGTTFTYDSGTKVLAKGRDGMDCTMEIAGGKPYKLRALLFDNPSPDGSDTTAYINALKPERLWPLEDRGRLQQRRQELALHPERGALRQAHRARRRHDRHLPDRDA